MSPDCQKAQLQFKLDPGAAPPWAPPDHQEVFPTKKELGVLISPEPELGWFGLDWVGYII